MIPDRIPLDLIPDDLICGLRCCCVGKSFHRRPHCRLRCCRWNRPSLDSDIDGCCESSFDLALVVASLRLISRWWCRWNRPSSNSDIDVLFNVGSRRIKMMEPRCWSWRSFGCLVSVVMEAWAFGTSYEGWKRWCSRTSLPFRQYY